MSRQQHRPAGTRPPGLDRVGDRRLSEVLQAMSASSDGPPEASPALASILRDGVASPSVPPTPAGARRRLALRAAGLSLGFRLALGATAGAAAVTAASPATPWHDQLMGALSVAAEGLSTLAGDPAPEPTETVVETPDDTPPLQARDLPPATSEAGGRGAGKPAVPHDPPGLTGTAPGRAGTTPADGSEPPGHSGAAPGRGDDAPGRGGSDEGRSSEPPGRAKDEDPGKPGRGRGR